MSEKVAVAEALRRAGRAMEDAAKLTAPGGVAESSGWNSIFETEANRINAFWGDFAGQAGDDYLKWVSAGCPRTPELAMGELIGILVSVPLEEWERMAATNPFERADLRVLADLRRSFMTSAKGEGNDV